MSDSTTWDALPAEQRAGYLAYLADDAKDLQGDRSAWAKRWIRTLRAVSAALARPDAPSQMREP